jgi:TfoX/Sxy family transcriptional regulator of competence genes
MAYDETLADRVRQVLAAVPDVSERKMFGGIAFMVGDHMACGVIRDDLMLRLGPDGAAAAMADPHVRQMDFTGRPMTGMVYVAADGLRGTALRSWVQEAAAYAQAQPPKSVKRRSGPTRSPRRR